ncbi:2-hydroxy-3-oxopropionate reductase [Brevibacillus composti]|uniref:2-hydroxy-3-oxopropionate reductase n=1 Tax=Brevibacillus composti TaxID=2796470 RepID=A0A7T5JP33_9BACL|nr:2-hydroxy-3-oxopropionate reductase [Brevibacillus composti]QQE75073.1 2-hydroxy-3-oxopropionate reductase [Brevibacillus composti]QUO42159.1 2-hydroxy-3-oxopropionate reductase [Brevibacillus composti]
MKVGFIGLGIMGKPMAKNLLKKGYDVTVYDINEQAVEELTMDGAVGAFSPREVAIASALIITMLPNNEIVKNVILGENGIIHGAKAGTIVVDMSSISPVVSKELALALREKGVEMLDAPVSGGEPKAVDGTLAIMAGGDPETFKRAEPVLACMGKEVTWVGENGCGTMTKLANQIIVNVNIAAMSEALVLAAKAGIDIEKMYQAIRSGLAGSAVLDAKVPLILERNFQAGGRIDINLKDLTNVKEAAEAIAAPIPLTRQVLDIFHALQAEGKQADDHAGIVQYYEKQAGVIVEKRK